jgi:hypothetical protein
MELETLGGLADFQKRLALARCFARIRPDE